MTPESAVAGAPSVAPAALARPTPQEAEGHPIINDVVIEVGTSNGTGSQSANLILLRTLFQMGVPVSGKNMFPSNIQGLPTWFTIRANKDGWVARKRDADLFVAMNPESIVDDIMGLPPGALCIYDAPLNCKQYRNDVVFFEVRFQKIAHELADDAKMRKLLTNMIYVGVIAELIGIERDEILTALH